jgi:hypothetical protein
MVVVASLRQSCGAQVSAPQPLVAEAAGLIEPET